MSFWKLPAYSVFTLCFMLLTTATFGQQSLSVQFTGSKMRAPLSLPKGNVSVQICGLEPNNSYKIIATPMAEGQDASFEIAPANAFSNGRSNFAYMRERKDAVTFAAPTACVDIQVKSNSNTAGQEVPMFLSIVCESCAQDRSWLNKKIGQSALEVQDGFSAQELIENVLVGGGCFQISNVTYSGQSTQIGRFSNGLTNIGFNSGVIMATGRIEAALGPNDINSASSGFGFSAPDPDLATLTTGDLYDMADIEFDFVPTQNQVVFEFAFASEEYCEYVGTQFNDAFGFFISGPGIVGTKNLALVPATNIPISINTINHLTNSGFYIHNTPPNLNNCGINPATGPAVQEIQYDGFTKKMVAVATVEPCQKYHIKLKIADVKDGVWDSAVFLKANSFNAGGTALVLPDYSGGSDAAYEQCASGSIRFTRGNGNINLPLPVAFGIGGSAIPGVDYVPISSPVIIPAGQTEVVIPITVIADLIPEGPENIQLTVPNSCSCTQGTVDFWIRDRSALNLELQNQTHCAGDSVSLQPTISGGIANINYTYIWSTGQTTSNITVTKSGTYSVTVSDGCGSAEATAALVFANCGCASETFVQTLGKSGEQVQGLGIYDSQDGNLYVTGLKQDSAVILKMTPAGTVIWTRTFDVKDGESDYISEIIVDSEGFLVGCGQSGTLQPGVTGFVFRYNPATNIMQWINTYGLESPSVAGLVELPNGNYLIYDNPNKATNDSRMLEITRPDGTILSSSVLSQKLNLGLADNFNSAVIHNGKLYGVGRYTNGLGVTDMRHALSRINLNTGAVEWSRLSHVAPDGLARLYGADLLVEENNLISVSYGSETDDNLDNSKIFLQKTGLGGNLIWIKRFDLTEVAGEVVDEVISVPDGYILYAHSNASQSDLYLIKTDKSGVFQWAKKLNYGLKDYVAAEAAIQSQIILKGGHLFFLSATESNSDRQMLVVKTTLDGTIEGNCDFIRPTPVLSSDVVNPANFPVVLQKVPFNEETATKVVELENVDLTVTSHCKVLVTQSFSINLCPGESVNILGSLITQDTIITVESAGMGGCDTLSTYTVKTFPYPTRSEHISLCTGSSVSLGGQVYDQSGTVIVTLPASVGCDTIVTYTISAQPFQTRTENISFCPGASISIGGQVYNQSTMVIDTLASTSGCDTIVTYVLTLLPQPTRAETITFCPGETVLLGGTTYSQPAVVTLSLPSSTGGCDTLATYTLKLSTPSPSNVTISCPSSIQITQPGGNGGTQVAYAAATASSNCVCPGMDIQMTSGLPSGSSFPDGVTTICYSAKDVCGQSATCCFNVTIGEDDPCDIKVIGCIKYELLTITADMGGNRTYRIRVTNNCSNKMLYTAIQVPNGLVAMSPDNFATYMAPSGNTYRVRSPNHSPQYSIRFTSLSDSLQNGESDIFKYTLPAQANVTYIHMVSRLDPYIYLEAHLNTFYCPIGVTPPGGGDRPNGERDENSLVEAPLNAGLILYPNPTSDELFVDLSAWEDQSLKVQVMDSRGQRVKTLQLPGGNDAQLLELPDELPGGLYFVEILTAAGEKFSGRFVKQN